MSPLAISLIAFCIIFGGALVGSLLPGYRLPEGTKDVVRLGAGLMGTIAGLVLGLLIGSANSSYETQSNQVRQMTAEVILLDNLLGQYGPETQKVRALLRASIRPFVEGGLNRSTQHFILRGKDGVCGDRSNISSRFHCGREDGVVGSLAARGVAQSDRTGVW